MLRLINIAILPFALVSIWLTENVTILRMVAFGWGLAWLAELVGQIVERRSDC